MPIFLITVIIWFWCKEEVALIVMKKHVNTIMQG